MAETIEMKNQSRIVGTVNTQPPFCITKSDVTRMKAAQPFMLMVQQIGSTKRATSSFAFKLFSAEATVTGRVAAELLVKSAISTAGSMQRNTLMGLMPRTSRNSGRMMKNWIRFPPSTTATYLPSEPMMKPADTCAESWAAKATMPSGRVQTSPLISANSTSCMPRIPFSRTWMFSDSLFMERTRPTATATSRMLNTFPEESGARMLFGMTERMWV